MQSNSTRKLPRSKVHSGLIELPWVRKSQGQRPSKRMITVRRHWEGALAAFSEAETKFEKDTGNLVATTPATLALQTSASQLGEAVYRWFHTRVTAPASGWLSHMALQPGAMVRAGTPLFAIIKGNHWWVSANFKETALSRIKVGQKATISFDMYPSLVFDGVVEGISESSGAVFSMLPSENTAGNWIKVTQRFPVQIRIINPDQYRNAPLRMGASATVTIDTIGKAPNSNALSMSTPVS